MHPILIKNKEITFSTSLIAEGDQIYHLDVNDLVTEFGFFIPYHSTSWNIIDYFRHGKKFNNYRMVNQISCTAIMVTSEGQILHIELGENPDGSSLLFVNVFPTTDSLNLTMGMGHDPRVKFQLLVNISKSIPEAIDRYMRSIDIKNSFFYTLTIEDIVNFLKDNKPSVHWSVNLQDKNSESIPPK